MKRIAALALKDLAEHAVALAMLVLFMGVAWALLSLIVLAQPATVTYLEVHASLMRFFLPVAGLALGNRLVVAEYHGRTQRFLESLPLGRADVILVKLALGVLVIEALALGSLGATLVLAITREAIDARFVAIIAARTATYALFGMCWFTAMGMLGRLRVPLYIAIGVAFALVANGTELEVSRFGPIALVADDFVLERTRWPVEPLLVTLALAAGWALLAIGLATVREGSVAETLAKRMSLREGVTLVIVVIAILIAWMRLSPPNQRPPYEWEDGGVLRAGDAPIEIMYGLEDARPDAEALMARLRRELPPLRDAMGWAQLPTVRVALSERLDGSTFERVTLGEDDGILVRANYRRGPEWDEDALLSELVGLVIDDATGGRALWEPIEWPRDGIAAWWPRRDEPELPETIELRALWATRERGPDASRLRAWDRTIQREGERVAGALAAVGIDVLEEQRGRDAVFALGRALYGHEPPDDFRAVVHGWLHPLSRTLREAAGIDERALIEAWYARLASLRASHRGAWMPRVEARIDVETADGLPTIVARATLDRPPPPGATVSLAHFDDGPFDDFVWPWEPQREERAWPDGERSIEMRLPGRYGPGSRVWVALDLEGTPLGAPMRLAEARVEVP
ncbi:ABC transporter permease [Sandaracinus amylolyticus]|uniref:Uncharacterized protein n=1 Tax=Sandaracinus amylolyticus TaxID=927083 RepID=A0A0F6W220_9BACT|nr:ABC transporter permease [Sandaracinus amylolyticus]AKF05417.1 hypothetical protein DB32_002566 [Sandaracinus amylolyticus]